jgi:hypothetical protein
VGEEEGEEEVEELGAVGFAWLCVGELPPGAALAEGGGVAEWEPGWGAGGCWITDEDACELR